MSFWPRLRRRSTRGRKRATTKSNPYAIRDSDDKYVKVHAEFQAQRAKFAAENGVPVSVVRFISKSARGWVYLTPGPPASSHSFSSSPGDPSHDGKVTESETPQQFVLPPAALPLPLSRSAVTRIGGEVGSSGAQSGEGSSAFAGNVSMGSDFKGSSKNAGRLVVSGKLKDKAWMQISKTAAVLFVKVLVFSRALGASTAFAFTIAVVVDTWNRGKSTFERLFSALATQVLTALKPYLSLQQSKSSGPLVHPTAPAKPVAQCPTPRRSSVSNEMNASPISESSKINAFDSSSSSSSPSLIASPRTSGHQQQQQKNTSTKVGSPAEAASSPAVSPLHESNKLLPTNPCQKLKSKLFKSSPARKGENSSPLLSEGSADHDESNDASSSGSSTSGSPPRGKVSKQKSSLIAARKVGGGGSGQQSNEFERPPSSSSVPPPKKVARSHELSFFRSHHTNRRKESATTTKEIVAVPDIPSASGVKNVSRSHELKCVFKSLGKKKISRSQELTSVSPRIQDLALPTSTVESLEALAFPFREEKHTRELALSKFSPCQSPSKKRSSLCRVAPVESGEEKLNCKALEAASKSTTASSSLKLASYSKYCSQVSAAETQASQLRKVKTAVSRNPPLPSSQAGELGRSQVLSREVLGSLLLLAILGFLLLGRMPAILGTACFCLVLSHFQQFFANNLTPRDKELRRRITGLSKPASANPALWQSTTPHDKSGLQSSEYRKRVLIEGLLDRGNRRGAPS